MFVHYWQLLGPRSDRARLDGTLLRSALVTALVALTAASISGCSDSGSKGGAIAGMLGNAASECVGATGPNSTPQQIVEGALAAPVLDSVTGEMSTVSSELPKAAGSSLSPAYIRSLEDAVFDDVPEGGDAAFADAVCQLQGWGIADGSYLYSPGTPPGDRDQVAKIPHLIRGWGRISCSRASDPSIWEPGVREMREELQGAKSNPEGYKESLLAELDPEQMEEQYRRNPYIVDPGMADTNVAALRAKVEYISATPADQLVDNLEATYRVGLLAVEHQCPQFSR